MDTIRMMRKRVSQVQEILDGGPVIVQFGKGGEAQAILLSAEDYTALIDQVYVFPRRRVIRVDRIGLSESVVVRMLREQVDENLQPWTFIELELGGKVGAYLVPNSKFWRAKRWRWEEERHGVVEVGE